MKDYRVYLTAFECSMMEVLNANLEQYSHELGYKSTDDLYADWQDSFRFMNFAQIIGEKAKKLKIDPRRFSFDKSKCKVVAVHSEPIYA